MRHASRFIAILIGCATYCAAAATTAYAQLATRPDPGGGVVVSPPSQTSASSETSVWEFIGIAALGALLAVAVVGLVLSLRHRRATDRSPMLHA
jgi:hypothetical protein